MKSNIHIFFEKSIDCLEVNYLSDLRFRYSEFNAFINHLNYSNNHDTSVPNPKLSINVTSVFRSRRGLQTPALQLERRGIYNACDDDEDDEDVSRDDLGLGLGGRQGDIQVRLDKLHGISPGTNIRNSDVIRE